jgi:protein-L-isoaspartate(D-aspartate) O-methyltransferase
MFEEEKRKLLENLIRWGYLRSPPIIRAFEKVPRHEFVPENVRGYSYADQPLPIGFGQTISAPSMIAIMMETLDLRRGQRVLEIGAGSGYNAALLAEVVGKEGKVVTIERLEELAEFARENLRRTGYERIKVVVGDGTLGYPQGAPWDRILVTACAPELPRPLIQQLAVGGKLGAPVGRQHMFQTWTIAEKGKEGKLKITEHGGCAFVPLIGVHGWKREF